MCIKHHQCEQMEFHIIGSKCDIHGNNPILATQYHGLQLHRHLYPYGEGDLNASSCIHILEIKHMLGVITCPSSI